MRGISKYPAILFFIFICLIFVQFEYERKKILNTPVSAWTEEQSADCALVLTGGKGRIAEGFSLLSQNRVKKLIVSGVNPKARLREIFPQLPFYGLIDPNDVILEKYSRTTFGNSQQSVALLSALGCKSSILITSKLHMYRALKVFQANLPPNYPIKARAVLWYGEGDGTYELFVEVVKSMFYRFWAY